MNALTPLILLFVGIVAISSAMKCEKNSVCDADQCCQKLRVYQIVSRRSLSRVKDFGARHPGTCAPYLKEGESCYGLRTANGYCGCAPNLKCVFYPAGKSKPRDKRKLRAGTAVCEKK